MFYSCNRMTTVGVKGLNDHLFNNAENDKIRDGFGVKKIQRH